MKPILFNTDMVRAILDNRKTVTRRTVKGYALDHLELDTDGSIIGVYSQDEGHVFPVMDYAPYHPGDILYVRESFCPFDAGHVVDGIKYAYKADATPEGERARKDFGYKWRPSIHMPREAARIFLRVTDVRVERLQDIDEAGAEKEGLRYYYDVCQDENWHPTFYGPDSGGDPSTVAGFAKLWNSTIKPADRALYGWEANPWVWVIEFERCEKLGGA